MHKRLYIALFTFLGILLSFVLHGAIEMGVIWLLTKNFATFSLGLSWPQWYSIHHFGSMVLLMAGPLVGFWQGTYWYNIIYKKRKT